MARTALQLKTTPKFVTCSSIFANRNEWAVLPGSAVHVALFPVLVTYSIGSMVMHALASTPASTPGPTFDDELGWPCMRCHMAHAVKLVRRNVGPSSQTTFDLPESTLV